MLNLAGGELPLWNRILRSSLAQNALALYSLHMGRYVLPLVTIPYLARVLGPAEWGLVAFAQAFAGYLTLAIEYGFALSGSREVARHRDSPNHLSEILAGVLGAKIALTILWAGAALLLVRYVPYLSSEPRLLSATVIFGVAQAFGVAWFYQGLERMRSSSAVDIGSRTLAAIGVFVAVRTPDDAWKVLALQAAASLISTAVLLTMAYRAVGFRWPSLLLTWDTLRMGWTMFLLRCSVSLYTVGNAFILGLMAPREIVGYYAGAEKISLAAVGLLQPISQTLYPRLTYMIHQGQTAALRLVRASALVMGGAGFVLGLALFVTAPAVVRLGLGTSFTETVPVLRILCLLPFLGGLSNVLGIQWMLPLGMDRSVNTIVILSGVFNIVLALLLAPAFQQIGMAWAVILAESVVTFGLYAVLRWRKLDPIFTPASAAAHISFGAAKP